MRLLFTLFVTFLPFSIYCQSDSSALEKRYMVVERPPFYQYCKNCNDKAPRQPRLCSHNYNILFIGYSYDRSNWIDIGYNKDFASCFPDYGGHLFSASILGTVDKNQIINGIRVSYFRDHLFGLQLYFVKLGFSAETYTNYKNVDTVVRPEIRIGDNMFYSKLLTRIQFSYGYNIKLSDNQVISRGRHQISINLRLLIRGWNS
jgi:hypothetical protein